MVYRSMYVGCRCVMNDGNVCRSLINEEYTIPKYFCYRQNQLSLNENPVDRYDMPFFPALRKPSPTRSPTGRDVGLRAR